MMRKRQKLSVWILVVSMLAVLTLPCYAMTQPVLSPVSSMAELLARYHSEDAPGSNREYFSEKPLVCIGETTLGGTAGDVFLAATASIHVKAGAVLIIDNPRLLMMSAPILNPPPIFTVERGGTLRVQRWNPMMTDGSMPTAGMIRVEEGGTLWAADGITFPPGMVMKDGPPDTVLPPNPEPTPEPEPAPEPELPVEPTPAPLPGAPELSVTQWQERNGQLTLWIQTEPMGVTEEQISSIDLERSSDGAVWRLRQTLSRHDDLDGLASAKGESPSCAWILNGKVKVSCVEESDGSPFYYRMTIHLSTGAVTSEPLLFRPPNASRPGDTVKSDEQDEDGSSGNRGGGSQGQADRVEQQPPGERPVLSEATPEAVPDGGTYQSDDIISVGGATAGSPANHDSSAALSASGAATGSIEIDGGSSIGDTVAPKDLGAQAQADCDTSTEVAVEPSQKPEQASRAPADGILEVRTEKPLGSADRNGVVLFASLALFGGIAVVGLRGKRKK